MTHAILILVAYIAFFAVVVVAVLRFGKRSSAAERDARVGTVLALASMFVLYPWREDVLVLGFPLPGAIFQRQDDYWADYVWGGVGLVIWAANGAFGYFLPRLIRFVGGRFLRRNRA